MKFGKKTLVILTAVVAIFIFAGFATAHGFRNNEKKYDTYSMGHMNNMHQQMSEIMELGTYEDFLALKESFDGKFMAFIDSEEKFEMMKEHHANMQAHHEKMDEFHQKMGFENRNFGMMNHKSGNGMHSGGCPMMN